jgi:deazaflavin-dependent oxidoreductase (nitroreductase family)
VTDVDRATIAEFRAGGGRVGGALSGTPLLLIHHVGARSGTAYVTPLAYADLGGGRLAIAASNGGSPRHPSWYHNLKAHPAVTVELGPRTFPAVAEEQTGTARDELWPALAARFPDLATFAAAVGRPIPLIVLRPLT